MAAGPLSGCATQPQKQVAMSSHGDLVEEAAPYQESDPWLLFLEQLTYDVFTQKIAQPQVNYGATPSYFTAPNAAGIFGKVVMDAMNGKTYPVPDSLTKSVASNEGEAPASPAAH